jgi:diguanylate cyclase (GGDEF)-like protein
VLSFALDNSAVFHAAALQVGGPAVDTMGVHMSASQSVPAQTNADRGRGTLHDGSLAGVAAPIPPLRPSASALIAQEAFCGDAGLYAIAVVDDHGTPVGLLNRFRFTETLSEQAVLANRPVGMLMDRTPLVLDEHTPIDQLSLILSDDSSKYIFDGFIVTRNGRYLGVGTGYSLMRRLTEQRQTTLAQLAYHDTLTGLPNRQLFLDRLTQALATAFRNRRRVALLYLDIDRFKSINDEFGHTIGDLLLQQTADRFRAVVRAQDTVARLSGDEFAFILTELQAAEHAELVAQKLANLVRQPYALDGHEVNISCSVGVAVYPEHTENQPTLVRMADDALYCAKRTRNIVQPYSAAMARPVSSGPLLFNSVRKAIDLGQLEVYYQPQAVLRGGALCGLEALVRWRQPGGDLVSTHELIQIAEEAGLISEITDFVCGTSMSQLRDWHAGGLARGLRLSINISGAEVQDGVLSPMLRGHVKASGLSMSMIELELTESGLMRSDAYATQLLSELRGEGVRVSVDDFGTGYSSLGRLQRLPVDVLKIDKTFVDDIDAGAKHGALVRAIVVMAHSLGLTVVAEGVETESQRAFLEEHGCDIYQGHLLSPPLPARDMESYLRLNVPAVPKIASHSRPRRQRSASR